MPKCTYGSSLCNIPFLDHCFQNAVLALLLYVYACRFLAFETWLRIWDVMAELAVAAHGAAALPRRCGGSGCTAAVRRCGGSVTAAMRRQPTHIPCHKCANPKRQRGRSKESTYRREGMMQRKRLLSLAKQFHLKKKVCLSSTAPCCMLYVCAFTLKHSVEFSWKHIIII